MGPLNIGLPAPPYPFLNYCPRPWFSFRPFVLQIKQKNLPTSFKYSSPNTNNKITLSPSQKTHPLTHGIPYSLYFLFFCFVFFDTLSLALVLLPTSPPKLQSSILTEKKKKKIYIYIYIYPDQFFLSSSALVLELGDYLVSFLLFLKH